MEILCVQHNLISKINLMTIDSFPHSVTLIGDYGSGKHQILNYISQFLKLDCEDVTNNLSVDYINEIMTRPYPKIYFIECNKISVKFQNSILKFLEEPLKNAFIILLSQTKSQLLDTILNRCQIWKLEEYSEEYLKQFSSNELICKIAKTPGQVERLNSENFDDMYELVEKIFDVLPNANISNMFNICDKINFESTANEKKFDLMNFINVLKYVSYNRFVHNHKYYRCYALTNKLYNSYYINNINGKFLFDNYLLNLKQELYTANVNQ